jgi:hypothetical protein
MNPRKVGWEGVDWMYLVQNVDQWQALVSRVMNLQFPSKEGTFLTM